MPRLSAGHARLTEVWCKKNSGKFACQKPGYQRGGGIDETEFHLSSFSENLDNLAATIELIKEHKVPDLPVIITVSPVPLALTWSRNDVFTANIQSKSTLRAIAGEIVNTISQVTYFPSYEFVMSLGPDAFKQDGCHVQPKVVGIIMDAFLRANLKA